MKNYVKALAWLMFAAVSIVALISACFYVAEVYGIAAGLAFITTALIMLAAYPLSWIFK